MTREEAIKILKELRPQPQRGDAKSTTHLIVTEALNMAIEALKTLEDFERAQIITGGRLNGRTYAYKCGLEDGKRKAIEQEPCEDAVSRQSVHDGMIKYGFHSSDMTITEFVEDVLPLVTPTQKWISTSEKLPRKNEHVGNVDKHYLIQDEFGDMQVAAYTNRGWIPIHTIGAFEYDVVAWQPLPMSYEEEKE